MTPWPKTVSSLDQAVPVLLLQCVWHAVLSLPASFNLQFLLIVMLHRWNQSSQVDQDVY